MEQPGMEDTLPGIKVHTPVDTPTVTSAVLIRPGRFKPDSTPDTVVSIAALMAMAGTFRLILE